MKIIASAPGKIHLMGEHAVVYGKPALLAAVNLRTKVTIESGIKTGKANVEIVGSEPDGFVENVIDVVKNALKIQLLPPITISVESQIPSGYHLGSSAAVAVATTGALMYFLTKSWELGRINDIAYEAEKKIHGTPSGGDNTTVTYGGLVWFRKELEFLKLKSQMPVGISQKLNNFFLIDTGRSKETTGEMVHYVSAKCKVKSAKYEKLFNENERQTKRVAVAIKEGNEKELIDAIRIGEQTLEEMGVVSQKVMPLIRAIERNGGAVKILGGGGRTEGVGFLLCYHHAIDRVSNLCRSYNYSVQPITLGADGVRLEKS